MFNDMSYEKFEREARNYSGHYVENCKMQRAFDLFGGKWSIRILYELIRSDTLRFGELKKAIPKITNTMLSSVLKDLEKNGFVERIQYNEIPPHVEYKMTDEGKDLLPVFFELIKWSEKYNK